MYTAGDEVHIEHTAALSDEEIDEYHIKSDTRHYAEMLRELRATGKARLEALREDGAEEYDRLSLALEGGRIRLDFAAGGFGEISPHSSTFTVPMSYFEDLQPAAEPKRAAYPW
jgi:hypothetical protein